MTEISLSATARMTRHAKELMPLTEETAINAAAAYLLDRDERFPTYDFVEDRYGQFLLGKTVMIVGGADGQNSVTPGVGRPDVYVRINGHITRQGGACDVLYHTCVATPDINPSLISYLDRVQFVFLNAVDGQYEVRNQPRPAYAPFLTSLRSLKPHVEVGYFAQGEWLNNNPYGPEMEWLNDLHKKFKCKLFTGNVALAHIMRFNPAKIFVTGMTMYAEKTGGSRVGKIESHETEGNLQFLKAASLDKRVVFSDEFKKALMAYEF